METAAQGILTRDEMGEALLAAQDLQNGLSQSQIARKFGVSRTTASRWHRALHRRGVDSLRKRRATGRPSRLNREQQRRRGGAFPRRRARRRVQRRSLDHGAIRFRDSASIRDPLRPRSRGAHHAPTWLAAAASRAELAWCSPRRCKWSNRRPEARRRRRWTAAFATISS